MTNLFSTLYGSRLYGTDTPESDRDEKIIVLPSLDSLLLGKAPKNSVKTKSRKTGEKNGADDIDIEHIPIQVFAQDFMEGQTYALELAFAIKYMDAEQQICDSRFVVFCDELRDRFLTSNINAMVGYAVNQAQLYSDKGERLNSALDAKSYFQTFPKEDTTNDHREDFEKFFASNKYFSLDEYAIDKNGTMRPCVKLLEKVLPYTNTFEVSLKTINTLISKFGKRAKAASMSTADWKAVSHALRITYAGIDILSGNELIFPYDKNYSNYLLAIKNGEYPIEWIREKISLGVDRLKYLSTISTLPMFNAELQVQFNEWILPWLKTFYGI